MKGSITKKQAGVIYRNFKAGNVKVSQQVISKIYDFAAYNWVEQTTDSVTSGLVDILCAAIDALFAGDYEAAQNELDGFVAEFNRRYENQIA